MAFTLNQITEEITTVKQQLSQMAKHRQVLNRKLRALKDELTLLSPESLIQQVASYVTKAIESDDIEVSGFSTMTQKDIQEQIEYEQAERDAIQSESKAKGKAKSKPVELATTDQESEPFSD
jgi:CRP-like cAMP-binding protein